MKHLISFFFLVITASLFSQQIDYNLDKGFIAEGYDVVAYFKANKAIEGNKKYQTTHNGAKFKFSSKENLDFFLKVPEKYVPQYGGWCAYALATTGEKVKINPKTFEIRNQKLYLFYNSWGTNTLTKWLKNPEKLSEKADENWAKDINK